LPDHALRIDAAWPLDKKVDVALKAMKAGGIDVPSAPFEHDGEGLLTEA
jgi:hypothetical protein